MKFRYNNPFALFTILKSFFIFTTFPIYSLFWMGTWITITRTTAFQHWGEKLQFMLSEYLSVCGKRWSESCGKRWWEEMVRKSWEEMVRKSWEEMVNSVQKVVGFLRIFRMSKQLLTFLTYLIPNIYTTI